MKQERGEILIYRTQDGRIDLNVMLNKETVWLNLDQMSNLFERDKSTLSRHIKNVFAEGELERSATIANFATVQTEGSRHVKRQSDHYNLDVIISVGYRVKSLRGSQFRQWASRILKEHLIKGFSVNEKRLLHLGKVLEVLSRSCAPEIAGISEILSRYVIGLNLLDAYDHQNLKSPRGTYSKWKLEYETGLNFVNSMKLGIKSDLFGKEKDKSFESALGAVYQTFNGRELYPSAQEKAANLLYLIVKNHPFIDGNKRIAAALFVYFLEKNQVLADYAGRPFIDNNALAAITLMAALSKPKEKQSICLFIMNMLQDDASINKE